MTIYTPDQLRDIDAAIAQYLFGWSWMERYNTPGSSEARKAIVPPVDDPHGWERCNFWEDAFRPAKPDTPKFTDWDRACLKRTTSISVLHTEMPRYSTDVAAAWEVVDKLSNKFAIWKDAGEEYTCAVYIDDPSWRVTATAPTMPLAVCLASLKAVGHPWAGEVKG